MTKENNPVIKTQNDNDFYEYLISIGVWNPI